MAKLKYFDCFTEDVAHSRHNLGTDVLRVMLTNVAPDRASTVKAAIQEIEARNGYQAGGVAVQVVSSKQLGGVYRLVIDNITFVASGGPIGPFRFAVLYNSTPEQQPLIGWWDYLFSLAIEDNTEFVVMTDMERGIFTLSAM